MFMLKSLFGKIWGDQNNVELMQLPAGALYLVRPESIKGSRECIYKDAIATIRRTTTEHNYQLVITRAYEEGEEQLLEEDEETDDERSFLIDESLDFRSSELEGEPTFAWRDLNGDLEDLLEFVIDSRQVNAVTRSIFEVTFLQCVFERKFGRSHDEATDEDLEKLKWVNKSSKSKSRSAEDDLTAQLGDLSVTTGPSELPETPTPAARAKSPKSSSKSSKPLVPAAPTEAAPTLPGEGQPTVTLTATADLYLYDQGSGLFMTQEKNVTAQVFEAGRFLYWLSVVGTERQWLGQQVDANMNMNFAADNLSAVWNFFDEQRRCYSWLLRFSDKEMYETFQGGFSRCIWETLHEQSWAKAKNDERDYIRNAYEEDVPMPSVDERDEEDVQDDKEEEEVAAELDEAGEGDEEEEDEEGEEEYAAGMPASDGKDLNSQLAIGYKFDRSFVVRGNRIGVFKHTDDDKLEFATTINKVATPKGKEFSPRKIMLHDQDTAMVMMDKNNPNALYKMDLEYGKIVDEWKVHDDVQVQNVVPDSKFAQMTAQQTLVGLNHNGVYRIDPRLAGNKLVDSQFKQYATKNDFSAASTDDKGRLVVASNKGDLRLFDQIGKNAKTALPALGDPIIGVDVTADGRFVIATCKTYLLLIDTLIGDGRYKGNLGFDRSFPAESKPIPRRLQLKPHHVAYMDCEVSFTPARFNAGQDTSERSIVTSSGPYVITWNFDRVKKGRLDSYQIKKYADTVVADNFKYGADKNIVVALPHDVQLVQRSALQKPTRTSLSATPRKSRSSIVDERF